MIAELTELNSSGSDRPLVGDDTAFPTMPLPRLDLPIVRSRWQTADGRELDDPEGPSIVGLLVSLRDQSGVEIARTITDDAGNYRFDNIPRGDYTVVFTVPSGGASDADRIGDSDRRPASYWPGDSVVPTPVHTWLPALPAQSVQSTQSASIARAGLTLEGNLR